MAGVDLEAIEAEAKKQGSAVVEKMRTVYYDPPRFSLMNGLIAFLIWLVLTVGITWYYGYTKAKARDAWWRAEIARKSTAVRDAIVKANAELPDDEIIKTLGDNDARLADAERKLAAAGKDRGDSSCPAIPARCLRDR